jgi:hypothetical protein
MRGPLVLPERAVLIAVALAMTVFPLAPTLRGLLPAAAGALVAAGHLLRGRRRPAPETGAPRGP